METFVAIRTHELTKGVFNRLISYTTQTRDFMVPSIWGQVSASGPTAPFALATFLTGFPRSTRKKIRIPLQEIPDVA